MKVSDYITHIDNAEDVPYLKTPLFQVNMRLFHANKPYKDLVLQACRIVETLALSKMDGYKLPHGMSGANAGIPWNIIALVENRGTDKARAKILINPVIVSASEKKNETISNCGSIRLKEPIKVFRHSCVIVDYYNIEGEKCKEVFDDYTSKYTYTIQHEIDHNNGILITDRVKK